MPERRRKCAHRCLESNALSTWSPGLAPALPQPAPELRRPSKGALLWESAEKVEFAGGDSIDTEFATSIRSRCGPRRGGRGKCVAVKPAFKLRPGLFQRSR